MVYYSTRNKNQKRSSAFAISTGISSEGGLFVPEKFPELSLQKLSDLSALSYNERAKYILSLFLTDFSKEEIDYCVDNAYTVEKFKSDAIAPIKKISDSEYILELWHGPTCAFKDMALQILPYLLTVSAKKESEAEEIVILVATSGDTGKAALAGFKDVEGTGMMVFFPSDGVSSMQKRQMTTQEGKNVLVAAIEGNFDDAQTAVKAIFTNDEVKSELARKNKAFSSANSINWGRLLPQVVYYVSSYCEMLKNGEIELGEKINVAVPTGNFGNILAAYYAKKMGVPINKLICASNKNNILEDFLKTGSYDKRREFYTTVSPSMDILISSNLERFLFDAANENDERVSDWFSKLKDEGAYTVDEDIFAKIKENFDCGSCDDDATKATIKDVFENEKYLCDTHTAVAVKVYRDYKSRTGDETKTIIASTANPYKFVSSILDALGEPSDNMGDFEMLSKLEELTGEPIPVELKELEGKEIRFKDQIAPQSMKEYVLRNIK